MPLADGYGVVIGTLRRYKRDKAYAYGRYFHENLFINTPAGVYHCTVDVDSKETKNGIEWRVIPLVAGDMKGVDALGNGWHTLLTDSMSGALDYYRSEAFQAPHQQGSYPIWEAGSSTEAINVLELLLANVKRIFVFGEPFRDRALGVHNVHLNQGDPPGSLWWRENGTWQDGGTIIQKTNDSYIAFLNKFKTQAYSTDHSGHALP